MTDVHYWRCRLVQKGPWVGVRSWFGPPVIDGEEQDRSPRWQCIVRTEKTARAILFGDACPIECDGIMLRNLERISEADYRYMIAHSEWATHHRPDLPDAAPTQAIDWNRRKPVW